jgi:hypothetical protein
MVFLWYRNMSKWSKSGLCQLIRQRPAHFWAKVGYHRWFIKDYAAIAKPWTDIVGKDENREIEKAPIVVTPTMVASYRHLK